MISDRAPWLDLSLSGCPVVRKEFREARYGMGGDAGKDIVKPREGIDADPLTGCGKAAKDSRGATAVVTPKEDPVVPTDSDSANALLQMVTLIPVCSKQL